MAFFLILLICFLVDFFKKNEQGREEKRETRKSTFFTKITVLVNFSIAISYMGFCVWKLRGFVFEESVFCVMTWSLASIIAAYSLKTEKRWPLLLIIWWVFSSIFDIVLVSFHLLNHYNIYTKAPHFVPKPNIIDFASLPFSILLCFNALPTHSPNKLSEIEEPFLHKDDVFSNAGIWSLITFRWLNPLFNKGHKEKLRVEHIPSIPHTETCNEASSLLEDALRKNKASTLSLPHAILHMIWRPLACNALFAGNSSFFITLFCRYQTFFCNNFIFGLCRSQHNCFLYWSVADNKLCEFFV